MTGNEQIKSMFYGRSGYRDLPMSCDLYWWHEGLAHENKLPEEIREKPIFDIHRMIGSIPWHKLDCVNIIYDQSVKIDVQTKMNGIIRDVRTTITTPAGSLTGRYTRSETLGHRDMIEQYVKTPDDLKIAQYLWDAFERIEPATGPVEAAEKMIGEQGVIWLCGIRNPLNVFFRELVGFEQFIFLLSDYPAIVRRLFDTIERATVEMARAVAAAGWKSWLVMLADCIDASLMSPPIFKEFCIPHYQRIIDILHAGGKKVIIHTDGYIRPLLDLLPQTHADGIEAVTPKPQGDVTLEEVRDALPEQMTVWGGIPSSILAEGMPDDEEFADFITRTAVYAKANQKIILGIGDMAVPSEMVWNRLKLIHSVLHKVNGQA
ncbi:MAG: hypothetical protein A2096_01345 [Spirochaetes bacterium GWF1_41_5]|nr:MAG: hypothetical protein A2096_01345 [Spirochaetes bacterium GWF1_41_5]HBE01570.1 hypothetical protein [Spirochaetia bacterium]